MEEHNERYSRHFSLAGFGKAGQEKLLKAKVLVIGAGGLGCPVLQYLAAAGIGTIGIVDHDRISLSNLQRQTLYSTEEVGKLKSVTAAERLRALNPEITITAYTEEVTVSNVWNLISGYDLVVDATDNFATRYLISDTCCLLQKPLVFGAVSQYEGQVAVFGPDDHGQYISYRDLFPEPPRPGEVQDCNVAGVLGVLPGMIGMMQANEVIKHIAGIGNGFNGKLLTFNMLTYETMVLELSKTKDPDKLMPGNREELEKTDYQFLCGLSHPDILALDPESFLSKIKDGKMTAIDVREEGELPAAGFSHLHLPLSRLEESLNEIPETEIAFFCQGGTRSLKAAEIFIQNRKTPNRPSHLEGGILALIKKQNEKRN
ncbi:HesA/MoeB/ThiF family protein [Chryseobacterium hagamense]|uniref:Molybdopterin-synthase adenylyltransferase n=1 Tax=Chryseobacterium hagamense TaxID=395935 RepID=A0A511YJN2_9FLAO|nr:HesA/MoeB/ThiF family protein [Chryseobacterium hagamense]GEN75412.1 adenylyltransferase/sulfurtransferase MoeZ [Chryseobacterium hagamense]